jgi:ribosomal protein S12 methylthiotransferase
VDVKYRTGFWDGKPVKTRMVDLVAALGEIAAPYGAWVRLHYVYPYPSVDEIVPLMAAGNVLPYLDIPLQHSHPDVLKRMKRPASGEKNLERIAAWRAACPELVVRSTFIAGFPGETEAEFEHLLEFVREAQIDRAHANWPARLKRKRARHPLRAPRSSPSDRSPRVLRSDLAA